MRTNRQGILDHMIAFYLLLSSPYVGEEVVHDAHGLFPNQLVVGLWRTSIPSIMIDV